MLKKLAITALAALALSGGGAMAAGGGGHIEDVDFSFEGPFGTFDQNQLQRGLKVYTQVCASCHGMKYVPIRTIGSETGPNIPDDQVRAYAEMYEVYDEEADEYRTAKPTDHFPESQFQGAPDLSVMAKARAGFSGPYGTGINQLFKGIGDHREPVGGCRRLPDVGGRAQDDGPQAGWPDGGDLPHRAVGAALPDQQAPLGADQGQAAGLTAPPA